MESTSAESGTSLRNNTEEKEKIQKITIKVKWVDVDEEEEDGKVKEKGEEEVYFSVNNDMPLRWLMIMYCDRIGVNYQPTRFEFKGARVRETDTPLQLSMLPFDLIQAYHFLDGGRSSVSYATICIRMYKEKNTFLRVRRSVPLLPQLMRGLSEVGLGSKKGSVSFVLEGSRLSSLDQKETADELDIEDGDIIDAFNFDESSSSLSIIDSPLTLNVINEKTGKEVMFAFKRRGILLNKLMKRYCESEGLELDDVSFFHEGRRLSGSKTVEEEHLNDGDEIYAYILTY